MAKPDIEILVGIEGGFSIRSGSGKLIRNQIEGIIRQTQKQVSLQLQIDAPDLQAKIKDAIEKMPPVKIPVDTSGAGGGGGGGKKNNGLGDISQLTKEINRRELKIVGNENKTEVQELETQVARLSKSRDSAITKYQQTHNITTQDILDTVNAERQVENILDSISAKTAKTQDTSSFAIDKLKVKVSEYINQVENTAKRSPKLYEELLKFQNELERGSWAGKPREANQAFLQLQATIKQAGLEQESFGQKIGRVFKEKLGYGILAVAALKARQALREIYTNVVDIDTAMTELKKVTNETDQAYKKFLDNASSRAKTLGATLSDTITATADFARLGYSMDEAAKLADSALVYKNVGDGISSITDASESVISTMKAFNVEADKSMTIVDKFNEVGNNFAISSKGVGDALLNSASALSAANNSLDESIALITAANSVVQSPEKVGTALKTVSMYLRAAKSEAEDAGESTDGMAESVSKLQKELLMLTGGKVNIMVDSQNFKSTYDILKELSKVWSQLSDVNQAAIIEKIGGKRQANVVSAILNNFAIAEDALAAAQQSAGSAMKENEKYLDSINGKISILKASYQELSSNILNSGIVKLVISSVTKVIEALNLIDEKTNGIASSILVVAASATILTTVLEVVSLKLIKTFGIKMITPFAALKKVIDNLAVSFCIFKVQATTAGVGVGKAASMLLQSFGGTGILVAGVTAFIAAMIALDRYVKKVHPSLQQLSETYEENKKELDSLNSELETTQSRIIELQKLADNGSITITEESELKRLKEQNALLEKQLTLKEESIKLSGAELSGKSIAALNGVVEDARGATTFDAEGNEVGGMLRFDAFYEDLDRYKKAKSDYDAAIIAGDEKATSSAKKRMENVSASLNTQMTQMLNLSTNVDASTKEGADAIAKVNKAYDAYRLLVNGATAAQEVFNDIIQRSEFSDAVAAIQELGTNGELTTEALINLYKTNPQVRDLLDYLANNGLISLGNLTPVVNQFNIATSKASSSILTLSAAIQKIEGPVSILIKAYKDTAENGYISIDVLEELTSKYPGLEKYLIQTANGYKLTKGALDDYLKSQRAEYEIALSEAAQAAAKVLDEQCGIKDAYDDGTEAIYRRIVALKNEAAAQLAIAGKDIMQQKLSQGDTVREIQNSASYQAAIATASDKFNALSNAIRDMKVAQDNLNMFNRVAASVKRDADDSVKSGSSSDKYKKAIEKDIKILQHKREMDLITDKEYYDQLEEIEERYYVDREKYKEEIWDLDQEIFNGRRDILSDWISDQEKIAEGFNIGGDLNSQKKVYEEILNEVEKMIDSAIKYGLDENSDYVQELRDQYHKTCQDILNMVQDSYDSFKSYADDFEMWDSFDFTKIEFLEKNLEDIKKLYQEGTIGWKEYVEAYNEVAKELYDTKKESIETIIDMTMEMIEQEANDEIDALDDQIDKLNEIIDLKKKLLQDTKDEKDHEKQVAEAVSEIAKLQSKIAQLSLDDSREAIAKRADLEEQLAEKQKELADLQGDYALDKTLDVLDETKEAKEDEVEAEKKAIEKSIDSWVKKYKLAIDRIDNDWDNLYDDLNDWMAEHRDSIDGPDSLKTAWENVDQMVRQTGQDIESIYNGNGNIGLNTNSVDAKKAQEILDQMAANSALAKQLGTSQYGGVNLHEENEKLADNFYKLTGQKLTYDNGWRYANGKLAYTYTPSSVGSSSNTVQSSGSAYQATVSQYGEPPSGTLKVGSSGDGVKWLQYYLKQLGYFSYGIDGNFYTRTEDALKMFQKMAGLTADGIFGSKTRAALKKYHNGGIVDRTGSINDKEVLSILETGEIVLDDKKKATLSSIFGGIKASLSAMTRVSTLPYQRRVAAVGGYGDTFAPQVSVNISHNGKMTDRDAKRYGDIAADSALEKLRTAFNKRGIL